MVNRKKAAKLILAAFSILGDGFVPMLLKNSLSGEKGGWAKTIDVHNRSVFDDLASGQVSTYLEKIRF
jgi:hypothetical protein